MIPQKSTVTQQGPREGAPATHGPLSAPLSNHSAHSLEPHILSLPVRTGSFWTMFLLLFWWHSQFTLVIRLLGETQSLDPVLTWGPGMFLYMCSGQCSAEDGKGAVCRSLRFSPCAILSSLVVCPWTLAALTSQTLSSDSSTLSPLGPPSCAVALRLPRQAWGNPRAHLRCAHLLGITVLPCLLSIFLNIVVTHILLFSKFASSGGVNPILLVQFRFTMPKSFVEMYVFPVSCTPRSLELSI